MDRWSFDPAPSEKLSCVVDLTSWLLRYDSSDPKQAPILEPPSAHPSLPQPLCYKRRKAQQLGFRVFLGGYGAQTHHSGLHDLGYASGRSVSHLLSN